MKMKSLCAIEIYITKISPNFFVHAALENFSVYRKKYQCITVRQRMLPTIDFVDSSALFLWTFLCIWLLSLFSCYTFFHVVLLSSCTFFVWHSFCVSLGSCFFFSMLNLFHVAFFHIAVFRVALFSCCTNSMLHFFCVLLFSCGTFFRVTLFSR